MGLQSGSGQSVGPLGNILIFLAIFVQLVVAWQAACCNAEEPKSADNSVLMPGRSRQQSFAGGPLAYFTEPDFVGSSRCAVCHTDLKDSQGNDMSITNHWRSTMMANAAKDPLWQAKVASEVFRNPAIKDVIEKKCVTCHMPMDWTQQNALSKVYQADQGGVFAGFLKDSSQLHAAAMDGVSCSLCHQIEDKNLGEKAGFSGKDYAQVVPCYKNV